LLVRKSCNNLQTAEFAFSKSKEITMPSRDEIREHFTTQPNGDLAFTIKVIAREGGVEINGRYVGPKQVGFATAAGDFGLYLGLLAYDDQRRRESGAVPAGQEDRWAAALRRFDAADGLTRAEASAAFRESGLDPRTSGSWAMHGLIARDGDLRRITAKGREWLARHDAA
jgi:hypothetical protein